jgi:hypothetical protein
MQLHAKHAFAIFYLGINNLSSCIFHMVIQVKHPRSQWHLYVPHPRQQNPKNSGAESEGQEEEDFENTTTTRLKAPKKPLGGLAISVIHPWSNSAIAVTENLPCCHPILQS